MCEEKNILVGILYWGWLDPFPADELDRIGSSGNVKYISHLSHNSYDANILVFTSKKVSKKEACELLNQHEREKQGNNWHDIKYVEKS